MGLSLGRYRGDRDVVERGHWGHWELG